MEASEIRLKPDETLVDRQVGPIFCVLEVANMTCFLGGQPEINERPIIGLTQKAPRRGLSRKKLDWLVCLVRYGSVVVSEYRWVAWFWVFGLLVS